MLENRKSYEGHLDAQLAKWKAEIDLARAKAGRAEPRAKVQFDLAIDSLQRAHDEANRHLSGLKEASDEVWEDLKLGTEKAWTDIRSHFNRSIEMH
ncbi:hypothetical protein GETHLI_19060 [Geothrix limicola]|uniref:Coiled coil domain-containing protein n=1 Tax=Geothrix limicola TaxID=2927978 RepID=A0ABQ5QEX6_9BACT|nr:hypothetical protein [Geothrix limicola]GLH73404.1 hypothetical protein GETHLI_19060 [Geothrix limicola]